MPAYPWSELGIQKTSDQRAIKSAYAAKLKVTRPEDDPAGFQALVEARDLAMELARRPVGKSRKKKTDTTQLHRGNQGLADQISNLQLPSSPHMATQENVDDMKSDELPDATVKRSIKNIVAFLANDATQDGYNRATLAVDKIQQFSIAQKTMAEFEFLQAVHSFLVEDEDENEPSPLRQTDAELIKRQNYIVLRLDEAFDWTSNDRRLSEFYWFNAEDFADNLQRLRNPRIASYSQVPDTQSSWSKSWLWVFIAFMLLKLLAAYFHSN
jgi:hypothetical protein